MTASTAWRLPRRNGRLSAAKPTLLGLSITSVLGAGALPATVHAQQAGLEEIVVTARFREENLQKTPLAITAITGDALEARRP